MQINKLFILLGIFFFYISLASALPIIISQNNIPVNITQGNQTILILNITNPNSYYLYDISIEGIRVTSNVLGSLAPNESRNLNIIVSSQQSGTFTDNARVVGYTRINCSAIQSDEKNIYIDSTGASPRNLEICKNGNVKFHNNKTSSIRVVIESLNVDTLIGQGTSLSQVFSSTGNFIYRVEPLIDLGNIKVVDTSQNVHDINDDGLVTFNIYVTLEPTSLTLTFSKTNFNITYNSLESGFVVIKNTGNKKAENIRLFGEWITFDKNNFDLNPGVESAINYVVAPAITSTSDTGKTYHKQLSILANNVNTIYQNFTIEIPFSDIASGNLSSPEWWVRRKQFCTSFPTAPDCLTEPVVVYRDVPTYACPPILANLTPEDVKRYLDESSGLREDFQDVNNNVKTDLDLVKETITTLKSDAATNLNLNTENNKSIIDFKDTFYLIVAIFLFGIIGVSSTFALLTYYRKKKINVENKF